MGVERDRIFTTRIQNALELGQFKIDRIFSVEREFFMPRKETAKDPPPRIQLLCRRRD